MELIINHKTRFFEQPPSSLEGLMRLEFPLKIQQEVTEKHLVKNLPITISDEKQFFAEITKGLAVAVNNQVIPKPNWADTKLYHQDHILIVSATQGG